MSAFDPTPPEPSWLSAAADQRVALMLDVVGPQGREALKTYDVVMIPLTDPGDESPLSHKRWDKSCDNCGKYCPNTLLPGYVEREVSGRKVVITYGACPECRRAA